MTALSVHGQHFAMGLEDGTVEVVKVVPPSPGGGGRDEEWYYLERVRSTTMSDHHWGRKKSVAWVGMSSEYLVTVGVEDTVWPA